MDKNCILNQSVTQSLTHPANLMHQEPKLALRNNVTRCFQTIFLQQVLLPSCKTRSWNISQT